MHCFGCIVHSTGIIISIIRYHHRYYNFCIHGEDPGRWWGTWEAMDEPERWRKQVKDPDGDYEVDLVESFFLDLDLC